MVYIGIDPGRKGAMAVLGDGVELYPCDPEIYRDRLEALSGTQCVCCLEHVGAMPGQGVTSMFSFGEGFGFIRGLLTAYRIPYELVRPQKWKREYSVTGDKNTAIAVCRRLFPTVSLLPTQRCRRASDGMAEALLMAEYARRKFK